MQTDDLFENRDMQKEEKPYQAQYEDLNDNIQDPRKQHKVNLWILLTYFLFMLLSQVVAGIIMNNHQDTTGDWIETQITWTIEESDDGYDVNYSGVVENTTNEGIERVYIIFEVLDDGEVVESFQQEITDIEALETVTVSESFTIDDDAYTIEQSFNVPLSRNFVNLFQLFSTFLVAIVLFIINKTSYVRDFKIFTRAPKKYLGHVITGFFLILAASYAGSAIMYFIGVTETSLNETAIQGMFNNDIVTIVSLFLTLVILTPIVEETVFRQGLYGIVRPTFGDKAAIIFSGFIFAFLHVASWGDFIQIIPYLLMGLSFSYIYYYSGRNIYVVIIIHMMNNFIPYIIYTTDILG